jgi:hypothetical protein
MKTLFTAFLILHIAGGGTALIAGFIAMLKVKGSPTHRRAGKFFFWAMTASCAAAVYLSIAHPNPFLLYAFNWLRRFFITPKEKQHWVFSHLQGFGAAYIAAVTAFVVVNINFLPPLLVWLSPTVVGAVIITTTTISYKKKFSRNQKIKYITD